MKKALLIVLGVIVIFLGLVGSYAGYVYHSYQQKKAEAEVERATGVVQMPDPSAPGEIVIRVDKTGALMVNKTVLTAEELSDRLKRTQAIYPNQAVILVAEMETDFKRVMAALDLCQQAGIWNVSFAERK